MQRPGVEALMMTSWAHVGDRHLVEGALMRIVAQEKYLQEREPWERLWLGFRLLLPPICW